MKKNNNNKDMKRRKFVKGSAIIGASIASPFLVKGLSGMIGNVNNRKVFKILNADRTKVGTLPILRAFAGDHLDHVSPFVLLDEFGPVDVQAGDDPLRVDAHPHAGVIPTTYFLEGSGHHKDSINYDFQIEKGDFMLFSSGRGAIHMEETGQKMYDEGGQYHGFQIWLNMPAANKFDAPTTTVFGEEKMGIIETDEYWIKVVLGELGDAKSSYELLSPAFYYHVKMKPGARLDMYQRGEANINLFSKEGAEFLLLGGQPMNEPVYSYGPFVMNNETQIRKVIQDYQAGRMGNPDEVN